MAEDNQKVMNRWIVVIGAIMIQLALGAIYAWSAFTIPLQGKYDSSGVLVTGSDFLFSKTETMMIFSAGLASFGIVMILAGRMMKTVKPRNIALLGGLLLGAGYISAGLTGTSFIMKLVTIGIIGGAGIGFAYVVPIAVGVKWFPDKKGLLSGLAVAGFGFGAFLWILLANPPSILPFDGLLQTTAVSGQSYATMYTAETVNSVFMIYGIIFMALVCLGALVMVPPPEGWTPKGWKAPAPKKGAGTGNEAKVDYESSEMLKAWQFYALWGMFMIGALAGLMVIGNIQNFAKSATEGFEANGFTSTDAADFAVIGAAICLPILNGIGRIVWGSASDKIGRKKSFFAMFLFQAVMMFVFFNTVSSPIAFYVVAAMIGFNFGGNFALFPAATADFFGSKNVGPNYGLVFTSYAVGGIAGPVLAGMVQDNNMSFTYAFYPAAVMCIIAAVIALLLRSPGQRGCPKCGKEECTCKDVCPECGEAQCVCNAAPSGDDEVLEKVHGITAPEHVEPGGR